MKKILLAVGTILGAFVGTASTTARDTAGFWFQLDQFGNPILIIKPTTIPPFCSPGPLFCAREYTSYTTLGTTPEEYIPGASVIGTTLTRN